MLPRDPYILLSVLNTRLRDGFDSPESLCVALDEDPENLERRLREIGYAYDPETRQYRAV